MFEIRLDAGAFIEVFGDMQAGDEVVIRGAEGLRDGGEMDIVPAAVDQLSAASRQSVTARDWV